MAFDVSLSATSGLPVAPVESAFNTAVQLLEAGRASLLLRDSVEPVLTVAASFGIDARLVPQIRVPVGHGIAGIVVERGISLFGAYDDGTFLSTPVITDRGVEGALNVTDRTGGKEYTTDHIALASSVAAHIGHLIEYGRTAMRDPVSGLPNRRAFEETLERELSLGDRTGTSFSVVFLDLNNLKSINDRFGHSKGDEVIRGVGVSLQRILRPYDFAGRLGGDEFVLLLSGADEPDSGISARIAEAMRQLSDGMAIRIASSVGVARYPADGSTGRELVHVADSRMYEHKRANRLLSGIEDPSARRQRLDHADPWGMSTRPSAGNGTEA
ncbi:MAG: hypothetical protein NVS2B16_08690 [Chloroflexota bacterium]